MDKKCFICTTDKDTADQLIKEGFQLMSKSGNKYTFINKDNTHNFENNKKCVFSDILTF